ncbi:MAG: hypothetical protein FJ095_10820 [Deltaproteobacteria bacterium]|nr:hypothetical protein [Deltaproteobacteria bacterium]
MSARSRRTAALAIVGASITASPRSTSGSDEATLEAAPPSVRDGEFRYAGDEAARAARLRAIEDMVGEMKEFARLIARARLERSTRIVERLGVDRAGTRTSVTLDGFR